MAPADLKSDGPDHPERPERDPVGEQVRKRVPCISDQRGRIGEQPDETLACREQQIANQSQPSDTKGFPGRAVMVVGVGHQSVFDG